MANPQKGNGYTPISNELLDKVINTPLLATHLKIILVCWRYSYGFSRKEATLSESFIAKATQISKRHISQELKILIDLRIINIIQESTYTTSRIIAVNKDYDQWGCRTTVPQVNHSSTGEPQGGTTVEPQFNGGVEPQFHQDKQNLKQNLKQDVGLFFESIWKLYPKKEGKGQVSDTQKQKLYKIGYPLMKSYVEAYVKAKAGVEKQYLQNGSTFFNSGYIDYLEPIADKPKEPVKLNIIYREFEER